MDKHYIEDLTIEQIERVLKARKDIEAVFIAPAAKAAKAIVAATADKPATNSGEKKSRKPMSAARKKAISVAKAKWWADKKKAEGKK